MDLPAVVALMKKRQGSKTQQEFAEELGISPQYLSDIYKGRRDPGETVLDALGIERSVLYAKKGK